MKRILLYIIVMAAALLVPVEKTDVGKLQPVEVVHLYREGERFVLETDTGDLGMGETVLSALNDLKATTPGTVFLDTADFLLLEEDAVPWAQDIAVYLKKRIKVCVADPGIDLAAAAQYLAAHSPETTLGDAAGSGKLERLTVIQNRIKIERKN